MVVEGAEDTARDRYENKMSDIFSEVYRVLDSRGALTVYFTDKEASAWDSLTMGLINAGFSVTATHTITSEMPQRVGVQGSASADSTLLLTCRKPPTDDEIRNRQPTLWSDIRERTREAARNKANELLDSDLNLTKTDTIISAFGPTLRVFTENYPVVDKHDEVVRPQQALEEARTAVVEVLVDRELEDSLDDVDNLSTWYVLSWLVYGRETIPYDDARQLGLGVGVDVDDIKTDTKIWSKSGDKLTLKGQSYRVRDYTALEAGEKRRKRAYPVDPREDSFDYHIDAVHATLNVLETKGSDFTWNWLNNRGFAEKSQFRRTIKSLLQVLPQSHEDYDSLVNLISGETGELLDIDTSSFSRDNQGEEQGRTTLSDF
jgi:adenine-specific DNA methylase